MKHGGILIVHVFLCLWIPLMILSLNQQDNMPAWLALTYIHCPPLYTDQLCKECHKTVINAFLINYGHFVFCNQIKKSFIDDQ